MEKRIVELGEICKFEYGTNLPGRIRVPGAVPVYGSNGVIGTHSTAITSGPTIIIGRKGSIGEIHQSNQPCWPIDTTYFIDESFTDCDLDWLTYQLIHLNLCRLNKASGVPGLNREDAYKLEVILPSIEQQRSIAAYLKAQLTIVEEARIAAKAQLQEIEQLPSRLLAQAFET
ncbi:MAG TPA: hypothetical protein HPP94_14340 [Desulfuromonadales bacterium]|nr:hypothetical protein [Desulfuromonadales bacterium]